MIGIRDTSRLEDRRDYREEHAVMVMMMMVMKSRVQDYRDGAEHFDVCIARRHGSVRSSACSSKPETRTVPRFEKHRGAEWRSNLPGG